MKMPLRLYIVLIVLLFSAIANAQVEVNRPVRTSFDLLNLNTDTLRIDTITSGSQLYNPQYSNFPTWSELGNLGFSALPTKWLGISNLNQPHYLRSFQHYTNPKNKLIQYQTNSPYALLSYSSGGSKDINGQLIRAVFARAVSPGVRFTALLDFINSPGLYANQSGSQSSFSINLDVEKEKYNLKVGIEQLKFSLGENGGVQNPADVFNEQISSVPIFLNNAVSSTSWTIIQGRQEFDIFGKSKKDTVIINLIQDSLHVDSLNIDSLHVESLLIDSLAIDSLSIIPVDTVLTEMSKPKPKLFHLFNYQLSKRLYQDAQNSSGEYYSTYLNSVEEADDSLSFRSFNNKIGLSHSGIFGDSIQWFAQIGAYHILSFWISNELSGNFQQFGAFGDAKFENQNWLGSLKAKIQLLGYGIGSYDIDFLIGRKSKLGGWNISLGARSQMEQPSIFYQVFSGNHDRWLNSLKNQQEQGIRINAAKADWGLIVGGDISMVSNWVYFDSVAKPKQADFTTLLGSAFVKKNFKAGPFRSDNMLMAQYTPASQIPLPLIVASTSTYMHHDILFPKTNGKIELEYGLDIRFCTSYQGYAFRPSSGAFYLQNQKIMGNYPYIDPFLILRVKRTRIFVKWEHVNAGFTGDNFFPVLNYPVKERFIKYGVYWHFYD